MKSAPPVPRRANGGNPITYNISKMVLLCREVGVWCRAGYCSMGPLCGLRLGQNASLTHNNNNNSRQNWCGMYNRKYWKI